MKIYAQTAPLEFYTVACRSNKSPVKQWQVYNHPESLQVVHNVRLTYPDRQTDTTKHIIAPASWWINIQREGKSCITNDLRHLNRIDQIHTISLLLLFFCLFVCFCFCFFVFLFFFCIFFFFFLSLSFFFANPWNRSYTLVYMGGCIFKNLQCIFVLNITYPISSKSRVMKCLQGLKNIFRSLFWSHQPDFK